LADLQVSRDLNAMVRLLGFSLVLTTFCLLCTAPKKAGVTVVPLGANSPLNANAFLSISIRLDCSRRSESLADS